MQLQQNNLPVLDARLTAVASYVREGCNCADIGCDHGKLSAWLAASGKCKYVYACDTNETPLSHARAQIEKTRCTNIECRLGDGLKAVNEAEVDDIVIAGLSGVTIAQILAVSPNFWSEKHRFIFVPASKADYLRKFLCENGFELLGETAALAAGRVYPVMHCAFTGTPHTPTQLFCAIGLINGKSKEAQAYAKKTINQLIKQGDTELAKEVEKCF